MSTKMVCPRDFVLRSTSGHTVAFKANVPQDVPDVLYAEALSHNIIPHSGKANDQDTPAPQGQVQVMGPLRDALIYNAIQTIVTRNTSDDFDGGGVPKVAAITDLSGVKLGAPERAKYWNNYREMIGSNSEIPTHPNVVLVQDLQGLTSRDQLEAFAKDHELNVKDVKGRSNRELKESLLAQVITKQAPVTLTTEESAPKGDTSTLVAD